MRIKHLATLLLLLVGCLSPEKESGVNGNPDHKKEQLVTITHVEQGIVSNIDQRVKDGGGYFHFRNDTLELSLKLVRVHTEYLSVLGQNEFFACVDLATESGDVYDVDFFLEGTADSMVVTRETIHKLNGKPFYTWKRNKKKKTWFTVPVKNADNQLLGVIEGSDRFTFSYSVILPEIPGPSDMWIPIASSDEFQSIEILEMKVPGRNEIQTEQQYGNRILHLELGPEDSNKEINIEYLVERSEKRAYPAEYSEAQQFLGEDEHQPVGGRFEQISTRVIDAKEATTPLTKARALYDYIIDSVRYAKQGTYGTGDANYACDVKSGNCTEFHSFFISLSRSAGIPARFAVGAGIPTERDEGGVDGYHCWAEFYADGKWWPVDISEANKYTALATYYFGHHPANRIELSRGRDLKPDPQPASGLVNFLAYPVFEIEGEEVFVKTIFSFKRDVTSN